jgi:hypothetical protein
MPAHTTPEDRMDINPYLENAIELLEEDPSRYVWIESSSCLAGIFYTGVTGCVDTYAKQVQNPTFRAAIVELAKRLGILSSRYNGIDVSSRYNAPFNAWWAVSERAAEYTRGTDGPVAILKSALR